ncbi:MAG TPA: MFS transporter [Steroidobacteraceae bacterium]|nr:MFS transporter [Steroidobacteraceae bacterium]
MLAVLLGAALLINYVDRGTVSIAAPLLEREFHLTAGQLGWLLSAFFWAYVGSQPLMGWLTDRVGAARVLAAGFTLWSVATVLTGLSAGVAALVAARLLMGVGESVTYPSALALLAQRVTDRHRARATSILQLGGMVGPALGTFLGGLLMVHYGWRAMFVGLGLASLLWLIPWSRQMGRMSEGNTGAGSRTDAAGANTGPSFGDILRQRALWGTMCGNFCSNYAFYFVFTSLPLYLVHERGLSLLAMTHLTSGLYAVDAVSVLTTGWLLDAWIRRGATADRAYKTALALSAAGVGACLLATSGASLAVAVLLLLATGAMDGLNSPAVCSLVQHFAGPLATGRWMGAQNAVSNLSGVVAPLVTGYLAEATGHYTAGLWVAGVVALLGVGAWLVIVPAVRPVAWNHA